jgi:hypothetical protein
LVLKLEAFSSSNTFIYNSIIDFEAYQHFMVVY